MYGVIKTKEQDFVEILKGPVIFIHKKELFVNKYQGLLKFLRLHDFISQNNDFIRAYA
jgi:hypothetical protein